MATVTTLADEHYRYQKGLWTSAAARAQLMWQRVDRTNISASWAEMLPTMVQTLTAAQLFAAEDAEAYVTASLAVQGLDYSGRSINPTAFSGVAADGRSLETLLAQPAITALTGIRDGLKVDRAMASGLNQLVLMTQTEVADAGRQADSTAIASMDVTTGYTRMLNPPSCSKCAVLAGRFYRWNQGFLRHPGCDCRHIPSSESLAGDLTTDPYEYFKSLSPEDQSKFFTVNGAKAINDGADIYQVVNSRRGLSYAGQSVDGSVRGQKVSKQQTREGTSRRGYSSALTVGEGANRRSSRQTVDWIYKTAKDDKQKALELLEKHNYVLPGGQVAGGVIRGDVEGYGQEGRGGTRRGASAAVLRARETGVRREGETATMTAAERLAFRASL